MVKIAMLSGWHVHAEGYAREAMEHGAQIVAVYDEDKTRGEAWAKRLNADYYERLEDCLAREDVEAVINCSPTTDHLRVLCAAANAGKHIFTEKVLAPTVSEAQQIIEAIKKSGSKFLISFPHRLLPHNLYVKQVIDSGVLGRVTALRVRNAHDGSSSGWLPPRFYNEAEAAGGAMMDLGAHVLYLSRWLMGEPKRITSMFTYAEGRGVDDNAVCLIEFGEGAIAVAETGFVSVFSPYSMEVYGTKGSIVVGGPENRVLVSVSGEKPGWLRPQFLPPASPTPLASFINAVEKDEALPFTFDDAFQLTEMMEKAYISAKEGCAVSFD